MMNENSISTQADRLLWRLDELNINAEGLLDLFIDTYGNSIVTSEMIKNVEKYRS